MKLYLSLIMLASVFAFQACGGSSKTVSRVAADEQTDLSGRWNDTDAGLVAKEMIGDVMNAGWLSRHMQEFGEPPIVIVGRIRNESMEHIDTEVFTKALERDLINSGQVTFVANPNERKAIRQERSEQQQFASMETASALAAETGAQYMLIGNITSIMDQSSNGKEQAVFYDTNLELIKIENNQKVWIGNKKIKKFIARKKYN